ncbi:hypothetical protein EI42_01110 [Thermosporothrix hazakensis]|uniref:Uncharacterized protein n=1 Tax=Thermosporothrix hazakensis TaxID=644383 RepID=A0A326ULR6_THEHA|nr:hypothetical protein EI42_01110 [Thermosporothrix hazakensis]GCE46175.1 hypothetical protein KTH_10440 [Thermosporothrix hazakensis]
MCFQDTLYVYFTQEEKREKMLHAFTNREKHEWLELPATKAPAASCGAKSNDHISQLLLPSKRGRGLPQKEAP